MLGFGDLDALQAEYNNFTSIFSQLDSEKQTKFISSRSLKQKYKPNKETKHSSAKEGHHTLRIQNSWFLSTHNFFFICLYYYGECIISQRLEIVILNSLYIFLDIKIILDIK